MIAQSPEAVRRVATFMFLKFHECSHPFGATGFGLLQRAVPCPRLGNFSVERPEFGINGPGTETVAASSDVRCRPSGSSLAGCDVPVALQHRARPCVTTPDAAFHPASGMPVLRDPLPAPEPQREVAPREPRRLAFERKELSMAA